MPLMGPRVPPMDLAALPCLPEVLVRLLDALEEGPLGLARAATVISLDPALTAMVFDAAMPPGAAQAQALPTIADALARVGIPALRNIALASAAAQSTLDPTVLCALGPDNFWRRSLRCALLAKQIAVLINHPNVEEAYLAALLRGIGQLALSVRDPAGYAQCLGSSKAVSELMLAEKTLFGLSHVEVAEQVIRDWNLTSFMADAVLYQHHSLTSVRYAHPLVRMLNLAAHLAARTGSLGEPEFEHGRAFFGLQDAEIVALVERADTQLERIASDLNIGADAAAGRVARLRRLGERVRQSVRLLGAALELGNAPERPVALITEQVRRLFGLRRPLVLIANPEATALRGRADTGQPWFAGQVEIPLVDSRSFVADRFRAGNIGFTTDTPGHWPRSVLDEQVMRLLGSPSGLFIPLGDGQARVGMLACGMDEAAQGVSLRALRVELASYAHSAGKLIGEINAL